MLRVLADQKIMLLLVFFNLFITFCCFGATSRFLRFYCYFIRYYCFIALCIQYIDVFANCSYPYPKVGACESVSKAAARIKLFLNINQLILRNRLFGIRVEVYFHAARVPPGNAPCL